MKLGILSESPADEMVIRVLVESVLGENVRLVSPSLRARGWPSVAQVLPAVIRHLHFNTDATGLVVVVDADDSVVHTAEHDREGYYHPRCRMCQLRGVFRQTTKKLPPARGRKHLLRCVGVAVPAVEGWYLCGRDETVSERAWTDGQASGVMPYTRKELKVRVYGTDRPSLAHEIDCAMREVQRHRRDTRRLEHDFPGFESLAKDLRSWKSQLATTASQ
ncbi:hypothetical protein M2103_000865 [Ereboglobus sp. PH5-5]|uniref:hypothetical protein n=1 Tax=Ereboglobus sp. PH5-5 TaxID=2940529 RepID=UPI0024058BB4|nr:hypothetical protein [Ereboglobus sp. PH5-5]MDF9832651.1 hypothetical protein [Ereboglobus sp. PH5-5]